MVGATVTKLANARPCGCPDPGEMNSVSRARPSIFGFSSCPFMDNVLLSSLLANVLVVAAISCLLPDSLSFIEFGMAGGRNGGDSVGPAPPPRLSLLSTVSLLLVLIGGDIEVLLTGSSCVAADKVVVSRG